METPDLIAKLQTRYRRNMETQKDRVFWLEKTNAEQAKIRHALQELGATVPKRQARKTRKGKIHA